MPLAARSRPSFARLCLAAILFWGWGSSARADAGDLFKFNWSELLHPDLPIIGREADPISDPDMPLSQVSQDSAVLGLSSPVVNNSSIMTTQASLTGNQGAREWEDYQDRLLGAMWGIRPYLSKWGIRIGLIDVEEAWGNPTGGMSSQNDGSPRWGGSGHGSGTGASYDASSLATLDIDVRKWLGSWAGDFRISGLNTRGRSISQDRLATLNPVSGNEADRMWRLNELWYQQPFFKKRLDVRVGQMALDTEFMISNYAGLYLNASAGWPLIPSVDIYSGGPSFPLASPGVRLRFRPTPKFTFLGAVANDNPPGNYWNSYPIQNGGNPDDPTNQASHNGSGTKFNMNSGALWIAEFQYARSHHAFHHKDELAGIYKIGGYYDSGHYPSFSHAAGGSPLTQSSSNPAWIRGNWLAYGSIDQEIWHPNKHRTRSLGLFVRGMGTSGAQNSIKFAMDAGVNYKSPLFSRPNDTMGVSWGIGLMTDADKNYVKRSGAIRQASENRMEATYQAVLGSAWVLQPDFQYIWRPGAGAQDYGSWRFRRVKDEAVFGLRSTMAF